MTRTRHPVVLIHGVFGYGRQRPLWNTWAPYWPEHALLAMNAHHLIVDVGVLSSDHDRACEAFYQLYGGRVDYGEAHAKRHGHARYGVDYATPLHPHWSASNPVHLLGHSFGATTAIELYQLLCQDAFGVGSDYRWVRSIVSIAGPLSGTTLTHLFGLHDGEMVARTLGHAIGASLCLWHRLHTQFPWLRGVFAYRMPQWEHVTAYREIVSAQSRILTSGDLAVYDILPARRLARNSALQHMDKPFLISVATSASTRMPVAELALATALVALLYRVAWAWRQPSIDAVPVARVVAVAWSLLALLVAVELLRRLRDLDYASLPCLSFLRVQMNVCVRYLHHIFDGFDHAEWEPNDGVVNVTSMLRPLQFRRDEDEDEDDDSSSDGSDVRSTASTVSSCGSTIPPSAQPLLTTHLLHLDAYDAVDEHNCNRGHAKRPAPLRRGRWYLHQVAKNHLAGTHFDRDAPELYRRLLRLIASEMEIEAPSPREKGSAASGSMSGTCAH